MRKKFLQLFVKQNLLRKRRQVILLRDYSENQIFHLDYQKQSHKFATELIRLGEKGDNEWGKYKQIFLKYSSHFSN